LLVGQANQPRHTFWKPREDDLGGSLRLVLRLFQEPVDLYICRFL